MVIPLSVWCLVLFMVVLMSSWCGIRASASSSSEGGGVVERRCRSYGESAMRTAAVMDKASPTHLTAVMLDSRTPDRPGVKEGVGHGAWGQASHCCSSADSAVSALCVCRCLKNTMGAVATTSG